MRTLGLVAALILTASAAQAADARLAMPVMKAPAAGAARTLQPKVNRTVFSLPNYQIVVVTSAVDKSPEKWVSGSCPAGMKAVSGSANGNSVYPEPEATNPYDDSVSVGKPISLFGYPRSLTKVKSGPTDQGQGWAASGALPVVNSDWSIELTIVCLRIP